MKILTKDTIYELFGYHLIPRIRSRTLYRNRLLILMYHSVTPIPYIFPEWCILEHRMFEKQLLYLKANFELLPLTEAVEKCLSGQLNRQTAVITFDDGYQNNFDIAFPTLLALKIPATIFLTTSFINTEDTLWFGRLNIALAKYKNSKMFWKGKRFDLSSPKMKSYTSKYLQNYLKKYAPEDLKEEVKGLLKILGEHPAHPVEKISPFRILDSTSIMKMAHSGLISFGAHTHHHTILSNLSKKRQMEQIFKSLELVSEITGQPCRIFAYPNGRRQDFTEETIRLLKNSGVNFAFTTIYGHNYPNTSPMVQKRIGVGGNLKIWHFKFMVNPIPSLIL